MPKQQETDVFFEMPFPQKGLELRYPYGLQPVLTTPTGTNVRVHEALTARARGGSRSGISKYVPEPAVAPFIQSNSAAFEFDTLARACAFDVAVTEGSLLCVFVATFTGGVQVAVTDTLGNAYQLAGSYAVNGELSLSLWFTSSAAGGANTVTATPDGGAYTTLAVYEFKGGWQLDQTSTFTDRSLLPTTGIMENSDRRLVVGAFTQGEVVLSAVEVNSDYTLDESVLNGVDTEGIGTAHKLASYIDEAVLFGPSEAVSYAAVGAMFRQTRPAGPVHEIQHLTSIVTVNGQAIGWSFDGHDDGFPGVYGSIDNFGLDGGGQPGFGEGAWPGDGGGGYQPVPSIKMSFALGFWAGLSSHATGAIANASFVVNGFDLQDFVIANNTETQGAIGFIAVNDFPVVGGTNSIHQKYALDVNVFLGQFTIDTGILRRGKNTLVINAAMTVGDPSFTNELLLQFAIRRIAPLNFENVEQGTYLAVTSSPGDVHANATLLPSTESFTHEFFL